VDFKRLFTTFTRFLTSISLFLGVSLSTLAGVELNRIIAIVNDDVVMQSELEDQVTLVTERLQEQGTPLPPTSVLQRQVLDRLILNKLQIQMAQETGIRVDNESLNRMISNIAADSQLTLKELRTILEEDNYSYEKYREEIRNEILISRLQQRQVNNRVMVTEREIENFLANQEHQGESDQEFRLGHILIATRESSSSEDLAQTRQKAEEILARLRQGEDFSQIAATYSDGQQALEGGDLGWRKKGEIPTLFAEFTSRMNKGDVSDLITSPSGFHIIKLTDVRSTEVHVITQTQVRHILLTEDELNTNEDIKFRLDQLLIRINGGADFEELAKGNSSDPASAADGGNLGWVSPGDLVPQFESVMDTLAIGDTSLPFQTQFGWHILQVLDRRQHDNTEDLKRSRARETIRERKLGEARENWLRQMRDDAYVEYRLEL